MPTAPAAGRRQSAGAPHLTSRCDKCATARLRFAVLRRTRSIRNFGDIRKMRRASRDRRAREEAQCRSSHPETSNNQDWRKMDPPTHLNRMNCGGRLMFFGGRVEALTVTATAPRRANTATRATKMVTVRDMLEWCKWIAGEAVRGLAKVVGVPEQSVGTGGTA